MASLCLVELTITGIYQAVAGRPETAAVDLLINIAILGVLNVGLAALLFRPVDAFLRGRGEVRAARRRTRGLPGLSAGLAAILAYLYCVLAASLGVFTPDEALIERLPVPDRLAALAWYSTVYAAYFSFYIYFLISDFCVELRAQLAERGETVRPRGGRFFAKLMLAFAVVAVLPIVLVIFDLTVFADFRAAQGLSVEQTIFLDLFASAFLISVSLFFVTRSMLRPIGSLMQAVGALKEGRLDVRVPVNADDELGVLTENFNRMISGLRERAYIRETFGRYVPESVAAALLASQGELEPKLTTATILYTDIEDFTRISESMPPARVVQMLNEYFAAVTEPINRHGGVVNQFQGDAMLVTFNVPVADPQHADHAVLAAIEIQRAIQGRRFAGVSLRTRAGINTGEVLAGPIGSGDRLTYTVHGDAVNLAARLEQLNKEHGSQVLVSGSTVAQLTQQFALERIGEVPIRGKTGTVSLYRLEV